MFRPWLVIDCDVGDLVVDEVGDDDEAVVGHGAVDRVHYVVDPAVRVALGFASFGYGAEGGGDGRDGLDYRHRFTHAAFLRRSWLIVHSFLAHLVGGSLRSGRWHRSSGR